MVRQVLSWGAALVASAAALIFAVGCGSNSPPAAQPAASAAQAPPTVASGEEEHAHLLGAHGGIIVPIGRDSYHAEAVFEKGGLVRLHMLGRDEAKVEEVAWQTLTAYVKSAGETESTAIKFEPKPQADDAREMTSVFIAQLPPQFEGQPVEVTIPSIRIAKDRFRLGFKSSDGPAHAEEMPDALADEEARKLFLTPGGAYTESDIAANRRQTAAQKFRAFTPAHDLFPKPGDKLCPITLTKANAKCTWVVGGKTYEFCCPPCVEEFVKLAKNDPEKLQDPEKYVKRVDADETKRR
ncbi:MAG TPA: hypothetical protein VMV10_17535 [Pirellulales bacterium]|nr:hypothetical protein [Pirellulales bacterium]